MGCYEHARDQGTLGSVAGCRHSRTPGRTSGFLIERGGSCSGPDGPLNDLSKSRDPRIVDLARLSQLEGIVRIV
jgi:hypothetical protein